MFTHPHIPFIYCSLAGGNGGNAIGNYGYGQTLRNVVATIRAKGANALADQIVAATVTPGNDLLRRIAIMQYWCSDWRNVYDWGNMGAYNPPVQVTAAGLNGGNAFQVHPKQPYAGTVAYDAVADGSGPNSQTYWRENGVYVPYPTYQAQTYGPLSGLLACSKNLRMMLQCQQVANHATAPGLVTALADAALNLCFTLDSFQPQVDALP